MISKLPSVAYRPAVKLVDSSGSSSRPPNARRDRIRRWNGAVVDQCWHTVNVGQLGGGVGGVGLAGGRSLEARAVGRAHAKVIRDRPVGTDLEVGGATEAVKVLKAHGTLRHQAVRRGPLRVDVDRIVLALERAGGGGGEARETVGRGAEALIRQGPGRVGLDLTRTDFELLVTELTTETDVQGIGDGPAEVGVEVGVSLLVETGVKVARRIWAETRVHRVVDEEVGFVLTAVSAHVPTQACH